MVTRTVLVTGANRGLGLATATSLHARGWRVLLAARNGEEAVEAAARLGDGARGVAIDVTDPLGVSRAGERIGQVDALVNNAGVLLDGGSDVLSVPIESVRRTFEVNVLGTWRMCQAFLPGMVRRGWGRVVIVSSGTGAFSNGLFAGAPGYALSKTTLNGLTTLLAAQTSGTGVLVNAVNPGATKTRMMPLAHRSPESAAVGVADAVTLPDDGPTGVFLRDGQVTEW
ncbi:SDR family NAD(P)-dependent oxidoreductase [Amycolatopsis japonica]|uniref:SDR family NAD(P)-dependent oxidoreductase n=1 Tax=Amycolatopsis japonica TaxID=208439 RepID=UPI003321262E